MRRTGSTCERRWPINVRPRIGLALVAGLGVVVATAAHAEWSVRSVQGTPNNVEVWSPGAYSVSTSQAAWLFPTDGGAPRVLNSASVGTYLTGSGCFASFLPDGTVISEAPSNCVPGNSILPGGPGQLTQVQHTAAGHAYALGYNSLDPLFLYGDGGVQVAGPWQLLNVVPTPGPLTEALGAISLEGAEHALFGTKPDTAVFTWYRGRQLQATYRAPAPYNVAVPQAIDLFPAGGSTPSALLATSHGLFRGTLNDAGFPFTEIPLEGGMQPITGVDLNTDAGNAYGDGFGMALLQAGNAVVLRAVPAIAPEQLGADWRVSSRQPPVSGPAGQVACYGAELCVISLGRADTNNLLVYRNARAPVIDAGTGATLPEGSTQTLFVSADDLDGDPVLMTVTPSTLSEPPLSMSSRAVDGGVALDFTTSGTCVDVSRQVRITASDGLARHTQALDLPIRVLHTVAPDKPVVTPLNLVVKAGGDGGTFQVQAQPSPCTIVGYHWVPVSGSAPALVTDGGPQAIFPSPETLCVADGVSYAYRVHAIDDAGLVSAPTDVTVQVRPWGRPSAPFNADMEVELDGGQSVTLVPEAEHLCVGTPLYPGVDTRWALDGGMLPAGTVRLRMADGGLVESLPVVTPELVVETEACARAEWVFSVNHTVHDGTGVEGPPSRIQVKVNPSWVPLSEVALVLESTSITAEGVAGRASAPELNCLPERGGARAHVSLKRDGGVVGEETISVPGNWWLPLDGVCEGGTYQLSGRLLDDAGTPGPLPPETEITVEVPAAEVTLGPLDTPRLEARCGEGARGTLTQLLPSGPCGTVPLTWERRAGPVLTQEVYTGQQIDVATQETDFGALIGRSLVLRVTANTGSVTQREHTLPIVAEPFVQVRRSTERLPGAGPELVGVTVELANTTACGVSEVEHVERLEGVEYVPDSARFNGTPVEAEAADGTLAVRGLTLEGQATRRLTYVVRPRLLGQAGFEGEAFVRGVPVSLPPEAPPTGCGCAGGGSGAAALGLAGLIAALRRRRGR